MGKLFSRRHLFKGSAVLLIFIVIIQFMNINTKGTIPWRLGGESELLSDAVPKVRYYKGDTDTLRDIALSSRSKNKDIIAAMTTDEKKADKADQSRKKGLLPSDSGNSRTNAVSKQHQSIDTNDEAVHHASENVVAALQENQTIKSNEKKKYEKDSLSQNEQQNKKLERRRQRVVILPGPHKTGTTSMQRCLAEWTKPMQSSYDTNEPIINDWTWPVVQGTTPYGPGKAYINLYFELVGKEPRYQDPSSPKLRPLYEDLFLNAWITGKNVVFGTEAFDFLLANKEMGDYVIDQVVSMMPWNSRVNHIRPPVPPIHGSSDDIVVSITYRAPRAKQLVSLWHEIGYEGQSLAEFIVALPSDSDQWLCLNPLGLANAFVEKGLNVVIIDSSGVKRDGLDISHVVACEVLGVPCANNKVIGAPKQNVISNKKDGRGEVDLNGHQLDVIEEILNDFDSSYCHLFTNSKVQTLHAEHLFSSCDGDRKRELQVIDSFYEALHHIKEVAIQVTGREYAQLKVNCGQHYAIGCFVCPFRIWHQEGGFISPCAADCRMCDTGYYGEICISSNEPCQFISEEEHIARVEKTRLRIGGNQVRSGGAFDRQQLPEKFELS